MDIIVITKNGKTFIEQSKELYEKNKKNTEKDGYRLATKQEIEARASKNGFKPEPELKSIKQKATDNKSVNKNVTNSVKQEPKEEKLFPHDLDEIGPDQK